MTLRELEQILAVCREGGISGAARRLQIAQPTLSRSLARVEASLSLTLFERTGGGAARPTAYALLIAEHAEVMLREMAALEEQLQQLARGAESRIRVAVGPITQRKPLPGFLELLDARLPKLQVETCQLSGPDAVRALHRGDVDMAFGYSENAAAYPDLIRKKLFEDRIVLVARSGHPAHALRHADAQTLLEWPFALARVLPGVERWVGEVDAEARKNLTAFVSDDYRLIASKALRSDHIALGPSFIFETELAEGRLGAISSTLDLTYVCWMLTTARRSRSPTLKLLADLAQLAAQP